MKDFKNLIVWRKSHEFVLKIYEISKDFPKEEVYGLTSQVRRASSSVPTNIAEGCGRNTEGELYRFLCIAMGSASEVEYQLLLCYDLGFINEKIYQTTNTELIELKKMLNALIQKVNKGRK